MSHVYPHRLAPQRGRDASRWAAATCSTLAREFGTPAYVYAEDDIRARARAYMEAFRARSEQLRGDLREQGVPLHGGLPRCWWRRGCRPTSPRPASSTSRWPAASTPSAVYMHGNNKTEEELDYALDRGHRATSWSTRSTRSSASSGSRPARRCCCGSRPASSPTRTRRSRPARRTPSSASGSTTCRARSSAHPRRSSCAGCTRTSARRCSTSSRSSGWPRCCRGWATTRCSTWAAAWAIAYTAEDEPPSIESYVEALLAGAPEGVTVLCEPGRSLVGNAGVTLYTVGTVKRIPGVRTYVAVDGGMSDNLRPMLYGARYEAEIADRFGGDDRLHDRRHALRVGRRPGARRRARRSAPGRRAGRCPSPAPTVTPWRTTTTRCRARRWSSARAATPVWSCAARPTRT